MANKKQKHKTSHDQDKFQEKDSMKHNFQSDYEESVKYALRNTLDSIIIDTPSQLLPRGKKSI